MSTSAVAQTIFNRDVGRPIQILLVEDSPSDVAMTLAALKDGRISNEISVVGDGEEAMAFLRREEPYAKSLRPDLILLDLNLPKKDGREVLAEVKEDPDLKIIPVIVLTTSAAEVDILRSYQLHANSYITKPVGFEAFLEAARGIEQFWLSLVRLPIEPSYKSPAYRAAVVRSS
jgi:CheY-like chemotaxis protein